MEGANSETNSNSDQDSGKHSDTSLVNSSEECWAEIDKINKSIDKRETDKLSKGVDKSKDKRDLDKITKSIDKNMEKITKSYKLRQGRTASTAQLRAEDAVDPDPRDAAVCGDKAANPRPEQRGGGAAGEVAPPSSSSGGDTAEEASLVTLDTEVRLNQITDRASNKLSRSFNLCNRGEGP